MRKDAPKARLKRSFKNIENQTDYTYLSTYICFYFLNKNEVWTFLISTYTKSFVLVRSAIDILFPSNHNIHKSWCGLCFWASDALIDRFY